MSNVAQIIARLTSKGIELFTENGKVKVKPASKLDSQDRNEIATNKEEIINYLQNSNIVDFTIENRELPAIPHDFLVRLRNSPAVSLETTFEFAARCLDAHEHVLDKGDNGYYSIGEQWWRFFHSLAGQISKSFCGSDGLLPCSKEQQIKIVTLAQFCSVRVPPDTPPE